jgi:hypothetical protein
MADCSREWTASPRKENFVLGRYKMANNARVTLHTAINTVASSIVVDAASGVYQNPADPSGDAASGGVGIATLLDSLTTPTKTEIVTYTSLTNNGNGTYTLGGVTRAREGTTAQSFSAGAIVMQSFTAGQLTHPYVVADQSAGTLAINAPTTVSGGITMGASDNLTAGHIFTAGLRTLNVCDLPLHAALFFQADGGPATYVNAKVTDNSNGVHDCMRFEVATGNVEFAGNISVSVASGSVFNGKVSSGFGNPLTINAITPGNVTSCTMTFSQGGAITVTNPSNIANPLIVSGHVRGKGFGQPTEFNVGTATTTASVDWSANGASQRLTLTSATTCTISFTAPPNIGWVTLKVIYPASGSVPAVNWPANVKWSQGAQPNGTKTLGRATIYRFYYDGADYWGDAILNAA